MRRGRFSIEGLWIALCNVVLGTLFAYFAYAHAIKFLLYLRPSNLLMVGKETLDVVFYLGKRPAWSISHSFYAWFVAFCGTVCPLLYRPTSSPKDLLIPSLLQVGGILIQIYAMASLNRSFGVVPANRGVQTGGMYQLVRHPLYLGYAIMQFGYVLNNPSRENIGLFIVATLFQVLRIFREEQFLLQDGEYRAYAQRTVWRMVPGVF